MEDTLNVQKIELRNLTIDDYDDVKEAAIQSYRSWTGNPHWEEHELKRLLEAFPEGQICIEVDGRVVGVALAMIVNYTRFGDDHDYDQITGNSTFTTHDHDGDVLYGIDVFVHPKYRELRLGRRLYDARKELCEQLNLRAIIAGGRIPGYARHAKEMSPQEYIRRVARKELRDPVLSFQLANDFRVKKIIRAYMKGDNQSREFATLLEWNNIYYDDEPRLLTATKREVRLGVAQWQMRPFKSLDALANQVEFFVDAVAGYNADFLLLPEFFNAPLMAEFNHMAEAAAIRELAAYTDPLQAILSDFAVSYNVNIIGGSMPYMAGERLLNVGYLCRRDGTSSRYEKIHITPSEKTSWGMQGGRQLNVFETDCGNIGVCICYDIEFPEIGRAMADAGAQIIFVPFQTDTQNGYTRVRTCAMSRAIENECYVVIAGCVGNLPRVNNMDIQFAQAAVFTPSDFAFSTTGVKTEATPNTEMTIIADVKLDDLVELHNYGSVTNLKDRRRDLYQLEWRGKPELRSDAD